MSVLLYHPAETEVGSTLEYWIDLTKIFLVKGKEILLPQMSTYPCATHVPVCPVRVTAMFTHRTRHAPDVGIVCKTPSLLNSVISLGCLLASYRQLLDKTDECTVHLWKIAD